ncbi:fibrinogen alpha chain-like [Pelodytes ibericus]
MHRMDAATHSYTPTNSGYLTCLSRVKHLHDAVEENILKEQDAYRRFARITDKLHTRLSALRLKAKEQKTRIDDLMINLQEQLTTMKRTEVDIAIKIQSCAGSCEIVQPYRISMDTYSILKQQLDKVNQKQMIQTKNLPHIHFHTVLNKAANFTDSSNLKSMDFGLFENIQQYVLEMEANYNHTV